MPCGPGGLELGLRSTALISQKSALSPGRVGGLIVIPRDYVIGASGVDILEPPSLFIRSLRLHHFHLS
jgi:hypothetical protein